MATVEAAEILVTIWSAIVVGLSAPIAGEEVVGILFHITL